MARRTCESKSGQGRGPLFPPRAIPIQYAHLLDSTVFCIFRGQLRAWTQIKHLLTERSKDNKTRVSANNYEGPPPPNHRVRPRNTCSSSLLPSGVSLIPMAGPLQHEHFRRCWPLSSPPEVAVCMQGTHLDGKQRSITFHCLYAGPFWCLSLEGGRRVRRQKRVVVFVFPATDTKDLGFPPRIICMRARQRLFWL
nr:MAG: MC055R [Molluscum contagiosum virus]